MRRERTMESKELYGGEQGNTYNNITCGGVDNMKKYSFAKNI